MRVVYSVYGIYLCYTLQLSSLPVSFPLSILLHQCTPLSVQNIYVPDLNGHPYKVQKHMETCTTTHDTLHPQLLIATPKSLIGFVSLYVELPAY